MEILGIGWQELIFIVVIAIIVLGPKDMEKAGRTIGRWLNQFVRSDGWKALQRASREIKNLPTNLMREANMDLRDVGKEIGNAIDPRPHPPAARGASSRNPSVELRAGLPLSKETGTSPQPPAAKPADDNNDTEQND